ncbi:hypothetical protein RF11_12178 [Thelohanellus kitauei]|uniref:Uncharacterized protein n=1 Tax=Thelohanellus kitauei TaxID=669202 RepID=A0A0C2MMV4_THEKT|nr:hypothetical protein RF11_12178 [Thelohanellus kitauei]
MQSYHPISNCTVVSIDTIKKDSFITFEEVPWFRAENHCLDHTFDFAIFVFDSSESYSFNFCREIHQVVRIRLQGITTQIPCLFVGMKKDLGIVDQISDVDVKHYITTHSPFPLQVFYVKI